MRVEGTQVVMWKRNESQTRACYHIRQACIKGRVSITLHIGVNQENVQNLGGRSLVVGANLMSSMRKHVR